MASTTTVPDPDILAPGPTPAAQSALRRHAGAALSRAAAWCEAHPPAIMALIVLLYLPAVLYASSIKPLWHDELYTLWIAQAPSLRSMWDLARVYDLNPPLPFVATHASYVAFGIGTLSTRLPEIIAFLGALLCLFAIVRRRMGVLFGLFAVTLLMASPAFALAIEARPYGLMFCFFLAAVLCWQRAAEVPRRACWIVSLALTLTALLLSHVFGLAAAVALLAAELLRSWQRRRLDLPLLAAILLPFPVITLYVPLFANHGSALYPLYYQPTLAKMAGFYVYAASSETIILFATLAALVLFLGVDQLGVERPTRGPFWSFPTPELALFAFVLALPLALMVFLLHTHGAFFLRYGALASFALEVFAVALAGRLTLLRDTTGWRLDPRVALLGSLTALAFSGILPAAAHAISSGAILPTAAHAEPKLTPCDACARTAQLDPTLPLVDASGLTFLEMSHRESSATTSRLFYLVDPAASARYAHANIFERMPAVLAAFHLPGQSVPYAAFTAAHPRFFVLGAKEYPEDWLLAKLQADGASIRLVAHTADDYHVSSELYEVQMPSASASR
jgi:hypothetical protein